MKTATYKLIILLMLILSVTNLFAQEQKNEFQNESQNGVIQNTDPFAKPIADTGTTELVPFTVFPNPANSELYVRMATDPKSQSELKIFNALWQQLYSREVTGISDLTIDISNYAEGMYYVRLTTGHNQIQVKKINIVP